MPALKDKGCPLAPPEASQVVAGWNSRHLPIRELEPYFCALQALIHFQLLLPSCTKSNG
jgi:hypothetical protein